MGWEADCVAKWAEKETSGRLLLEGKELLFRGDRRLKIALSSILDLEASDGILNVRCPEFVVAFRLGPKASEWRNRILHPKSRLDKLGIDKECSVAVLNIEDEGLWEELRERECKIAQKDHLASAQVVLLGADTRADLNLLAEIRPGMNAKAALWVVYPKGQRAITESIVMEAGHAAGFVIPKVCAFSETHTGLKMVRPKPPARPRQR